MLERKPAALERAGGEEVYSDESQILARFQTEQEAEGDINRRSWD